MNDMETLKDENAKQRLKIKELRKQLKDETEAAFIRGQSHYDDSIREKEKQIETLNQFIEKLQQAKIKLNQQVGHIEAWEESRKKIYQALMEISITLFDLQEDYPEIPSRFEQAFKGFHKDMIAGANAINTFFEKADSPGDIRQVKVS
jgi:DNA repair exonuclease SbcCD ATPase subunit